MDRFCFAMAIITDALTEMQKALDNDDEHPLKGTLTEIHGHAHKFIQIVDEILRDAPVEHMTKPIDEFYKLRDEGKSTELPTAV